MCLKWCGDDVAVRHLAADLVDDLRQRGRGFEALDIFRLVPDHARGAQVLGVAAAQPRIGVAGGEEKC